MADSPSDLKYTKEHEWARQEGNKVIIGVTQHAQEALGDVVYVELPKVGAVLEAGKSFGVIESTKAVSELFAPLSGKVTRVNSELTSAPETVNKDPYRAGWIIEIEPTAADQFKSLLSSEDYQKLLK